MSPRWPVSLTAHGDRIQARASGERVDQPLPLVRPRAGGGRGLLHDGLPQLLDGPHDPLARGRPRRAGHGAGRRVLTLDGLLFRGINGGPEHAGFTETISFSVGCRNQAEVDHYWESLTADGGQESVCGWLKDRFGLSWQIVPTGGATTLLQDPNPARATARHRGDVASMRKIVLAELEAAADAVG